MWVLHIQTDMLSLPASMSIGTHSPAGMFRFLGHRGVEEGVGVCRSPRHPRLLVLMPLAAYMYKGFMTVTGVPAAAR